jgi:hypothetical protein
MAEECGELAAKHCGQADGSWRVVQCARACRLQHIRAVAGQPAAAAAEPAAQAPVIAAATTLHHRWRAGAAAAVIEACPQPDGGWRVTQNTPGLPAQVYEVPPPAVSPYPYGYPYSADYAYPEYFPYWAGAPWFFGLAPSIVVVQRFNHFHHGFGHGFGHGFARGFGHGFAAARGGGGGGRR